MLEHPGAIQVPTRAPKWPKTAPKWCRLAQNHQNACPQMAQMILKHFPWVYYMIKCNVGPPWAFSEANWSPIMVAQNSKKWPFMTPNGPKTLLMGII